jgi:hypothetical protein
LGLFGLAQGLKGLGLVVRSAGGGLGLGHGANSDARTTGQDGKLTVSHACFVEQTGKEINFISLPNCASQARAKG